MFSGIYYKRELLAGKNETSARINVLVTSFYQRREIEEKTFEKNNRCVFRK